MSSDVDSITYSVEENCWEYQASSPDEKALTEACRRYTRKCQCCHKFSSTVYDFLYTRFGVIYEGETNGECTISVQGEIRKYRRLHILEFDSDRKRMSVIVQFPDSSLWMLCKGAESTVLPRCVMGPILETERHVQDYAMVYCLRLNLHSFKILSRSLVYHIAWTSYFDDSFAAPFTRRIPRNRSCFGDSSPIDDRS